MTVPAWFYLLTVLPLAALAGAGVVGLWQWAKIPVTYGSHAAPRTDVDQASANVTRARAKLAASLDQLSDASRREFVELGPNPEDDSDDWPAIIRGPLDVEDQGADVAEELDDYAGASGPGLDPLPAPVPFRPEYGDPDPRVDDVGPPLARPYVDDQPEPARPAAAAVPFEDGPASAPPASASGWPATVTIPGSEA